MQPASELIKSVVPLKKSTDFDHVYAIIRLDKYMGDEVSPERKVTVKRLVWTAEDAEREVARLKSLETAVGRVYFSQVTRLQKKDVAAVEKS